MIDNLNELLDNPEFLAQGWQALFPDKQGLNLEIGSGYGHFLAWLAPRHPEQAFIGLDIVSKVLKRAQRRLDQADASNALLAKLDAQLTLNELIAPATLDHLYILFPDPWPKNQRRRSLRDDTLPLFASRLKAGGRLIFVSDDPDYSRDARELLDASVLFTATDFPPIEVKTKYEQKWLAQDKTITRLAYTRKPLPDLPDTGHWPGYSGELNVTLPDWSSTKSADLFRRFAPALRDHDDLTLRLHACYRASFSDTLRLRLILARPGSLAQHTWFDLDAQGRLSPAPGNSLPFLRHREALLQTVSDWLCSL